MLSDHAWLEIARVLNITQRELQIIQAIFNNLHKDSIADRLGISAHTVHTHSNRLYKKLNVTTRTELVLRVMEQMIALTLSESGVLPPICPHHHSGACSRRNPPAKSSTPSPARAAER